jgi:carbonic anhydrase/acetyltransferase-like protein (isoleucine patch superfamily)
VAASQGVPTSLVDTVRRVLGDAVQAGWSFAVDVGTIRPGNRRARRFARFGERSAICFPVAALFGEQAIEVGDGCIVGPYASLSAGVSPDDVPDTPVVRIGDRCVIGKGSAVIGHERVEIGADVWTGNHVYITDANHGYVDRDEPVGRQFAAPRPVRIGSGSWLGHGALVVGGATIGEHVVIGAGAVVTGDLRDYSVAVGNPARVIRRYVTGEGWVRVADEDDAHPAVRRYPPAAGDG